MAKGRKNLKRKGAKRVRQRQKRHDIVKCATTTCRQEWVKGTTMAGNYAKMGLAANVNDISGGANVVLAEDGDTHKTKTLGGEWLEQKKAGLMKEAPRRVPFYMSEEGMAYVKPLIDQYGTDYKKMARDIKLNSMQETPSWLKRKCARYANFIASQDKPKSLAN